MKKYIKGEPIKSLDELASQEFIYWNDKITHKGWFLSWQLKMTVDAIQAGIIFKAIKQEGCEDRAMELDSDTVKSLDEIFDGGKKIELKKGSQVICISVDEAQSRWGGNDSAANYLEIGKIYTLACEPEVHSWHTKLYFEEVPGRKFNSVQFKEVER